MKKLVAAFIAAVTALAGIGLGVSPARAHTPGIVLYGWGTPTLNGVIAPGEWAGARRTDITVNTPDGGTTPGSVWAMNDANNLYLAVRFARTIVDPGNSAGFEFDNNHNGITENGEDAFVYNPNAAIPFFDDFRLTNGNAPSDTEYGGTNDGTGAFSNNGTATVYELSHPLDTADNAHDFSLHPGDTVGFQVFIRMIGPNADYPVRYGDTSYPNGGRESWGDILILASPPPTPSYIVTVQAVAPGPGSPPLPARQLTVPVEWSRTNGPSPNSGVSTTVFNLLAGGSVTLTAPSTTNNGILQFKQWLVGTPPNPPSSTSARTLNFVANANKLATATYQPIVSSLGPINPVQADVNPVGTAHTVWVNIGVAVAGVRVNFSINGPNSTRSGYAPTDDTGKAAFSYTGSDDGMDTIFAYLDVNGNGIYDDGEPRSPNSTMKSWVANFVTGGGNIKEEKKVVATFSATVGVLPEGGAVGNVEIHDIASGETYTLNQFSVLLFSGPPTDSPGTSNNTARFRGTGTRSSDGASVEIVTMMQDNAEPGAGADKIAAELVRVNGALDVRGIIGSVNIPEDTASVLRFVTISGGNFQVHDLRATDTRPGRIILVKQTNPDSASDKFGFTMSYGAQIGYPNGLLMPDGFQVDSGFVLAPGTYVITEAPTAGWTLTSIDINDPSGDSSAIGYVATIDLAAGETVTVIYDNSLLLP